MQLYNSVTNSIKWIAVLTTLNHLIILLDKEATTIKSNKKVENNIYKVSSHD